MEAQTSVWIVWQLLNLKWKNKSHANARMNAAYFKSVKNWYSDIMRCLFRIKKGNWWHFFLNNQKKHIHFHRISYNIQFSLLFFHIDFVFGECLCENVWILCFQLNHSRSPISMHIYSIYFWAMLWMFTWNWS